MLGEGAALLGEVGAGGELDGLLAFSWIGAGFVLPARRCLGFGGGEPVALFGDADGDDVVLLLVDGFEDAGGGEEGDLVLAGAAAEEDADA